MSLPAKSRLPHATPLRRSVLDAAWALCALLAAILAPSIARADHPAVGFGSGIAGPIITIPAYTLPAGKWAASARVEHISFRTFSDSDLVALAAKGTDAHSTRNVTGPSVSVAYGVTPTFTLAARLPYVVRQDIREGHLEGTTAVAHHHGDSRGFGDIALTGQFLVLDRERAKVAALTGLKTPTGRTGVTDAEGERLETEHQPGSGSFDFMEGVSGSARVPFGSLDANLLLVLATHGAQETTLGNLVNYNVAVSTKVSGAHEHHHAPGTPPHHDPSVVGADLILELNGESRAKERIGGITNPNSGGNLIYLSPGVRFGHESWSFSLSAGFPIAQDVNGTQHETDWRMLGGFGMSF